MDSSNKTRYIAEARFLRAYFYFDLVRLFGNIPLVTKALDPTEYYQPQAKPEEVYKLIAEDRNSPSPTCRRPPTASFPRPITGV
ncbi:RagB/SusD family nutrient uptake outer membrane protein [Chitinophaga sedimenti]|uniref:RagB/SusD family nutrient uptake outer membrane protein n=1 Tax=Chitinophaga sedimenti TaxID=2033606 RepID=UPI002004BA59|nr:RagB/SusD family nutrient uptake outer membrane protein [Chitinophaga sedimenti]MCK7554762.1 RagB/SusD family nutrient uptake outer membrane protein [Chitinophaga sedimenti]